MTTRGCMLLSTGLQWRLGEEGAGGCKGARLGCADRSEVFGGEGFGK